MEGPIIRRFRLAHHLRAGLWFVPMVCVLAGVVLSLVTTAVDDGSVVPRSVSGGPAAALQILYLISFAMLTLTGLVLSLLVVVVQLAVGTFSPRIVRQLLEDRPSQLAIGLFAATFSHSIVTMRRVGVETGYVPGLAVLVAIVLVLACLLALIWYVGHMGRSLRAAALVGWVGNDALKVLDRLYGDPGPAVDLGPDTIPAPGRGGILFAVDHGGLVRLARRTGCCLELLWSVGVYVPTGAPLFRIHGTPEGLSWRDATRRVAFGPERTLEQDLSFGIRMLVDIAERSISSSPFSDPTTCVHAIDRIHELLRELVRRPFPSGRYHDEDGELRLVVPTMSWSGYVRLAFDEIRQAGADSPQVSRRLMQALDDLVEVAPQDRRAPLERQRTLLAGSAVEQAESDADRRAAIVPDPLGLGSGDDLHAPENDATGR